MWTLLFLLSIILFSISTLRWINQFIFAYPSRFIFWIIWVFLFLLSFPAFSFSFCTILKPNNTNILLSYDLIPLLIENPSINIFSMSGGSNSIHKPLSLKEFLASEWGSLLVILILTILIIYLTINILRRKQAEKALRNSQTLYYSLVENLPQFIFRKDLSGCFTFVNQRFAQFINKKPEEIIGRRDDDLFPKELAEKYQKDDWKVIQTGNILEAIEENRDSEGNMIYVQVVKTPVLDAQGKTLGIQGIFWDITDRILAQEELDKNREMLETAQKVAHIGSWVSDYSTNQLTWSNEVYRIFGVDPETFDESIESFYQMVHPDDVDAVRHTAQTAIRNQESYSIDHRIVKTDSNIRWVHEQAELILDDEGQPIQMVGTVQDITPRKEVEEALRESRQMLKIILDSIPVRVFWKDKNSVYLGCNHIFAQDAGLDSPDEIIGKKDNELAWQKMASQYVSDDALVISSGQPKTNYEEPQVRSDGSQFWLRTSKIPLRDTKGNIIGVLGTYEDITSHKSLEEQLRQSQKMEAVGQLAGGIAHDFNNLLVAIIGYSDLLIDTLGENDPNRKNMIEIKRAGERAEALTRQLLAFSRKQVLRPKIINLNDMMIEMDKMLRRLIGEDIELVTIPDPFLKQVKADPGQIEQVIINLAINARDAMPNGGKLTLETKNVYLEDVYAEKHVDVTAGYYVMLAVSDTGVGIDESIRNQIFEPFFTTKSKDKGTGLGLSTVYGIIKQSGGNIWVYSEIGQGTTFKIYFPQIEQPKEWPEPAHLHSESLSGDESILVVEDDTLVRNLIEQSLLKYGYKVITAEYGQQAMEISETIDSPVQLLITDVIMPGMSGRDLATKLSERFPDLKILFISGYTDDAIVHHGVLDPGLSFLQKPFTPHAIAKKVRELLDHSQG